MCISFYVIFAVHFRIAARVRRSEGSIINRRKIVNEILIPHDSSENLRSFLCQVSRLMRSIAPITCDASRKVVNLCHCKRNFHRVHAESLTHDNHVVCALACDNLICFSQVCFVNFNIAYFIYRFGLTITQHATETNRSAFRFRTELQYTVRS